MRLIYADVLKDCLMVKELPQAMIPMEMIGALIDSMPTVDAVQVIRCKDCRWGIKKTNCKGEDMINCCNKETPVCDSCMLVEPDWFCADGEWGYCE